jgi:hypothetical protein
MTWYTTNITGKRRTLATIVESTDCKEIIRLSGKQSVLFFKSHRTVHLNSRGHFEK